MPVNATDPLFQSLNSGETWKKITANLPFSFAYFEEIVFAGATVYVVTDQGVINSHDGIKWHALTDTDGNRPLIARIAIDGDKVYGVCNQGVYRIDTDMGTWIQISSEVPYKITAFAVDRGIFLYRHTASRCPPLHKLTNPTIKTL